MAPKDPTSSPAPSAPAATKKAVKSKKRRRRKAKPRISTVTLDPADKVFAKPEYQLPYRLAVLTKGPKGRNRVEPPGWIMAAVKSGLAVMVPPHEAGQGDGLLKPIGDHPPPRLSDGKTLKQLLEEGIARTLKQMEKRK